MGQTQPHKHSHQPITLGRSSFDNWHCSIYDHGNKKTNDRLLSFAKKIEKEELSDSESTKSEHLLQQWVFLNGVRSLLPLTSAVVAGVIVLT